MDDFGVLESLIAGFLALLPGVLFMAFFWGTGALLWYPLTYCAVIVVACASSVRHALARSR